VEAPSFAEAVRFVGLVGEAAEKLDHHPDVDLRWRRVTLTCSTHSAGGVTGLDLALLAHALELAEQVGATVVDPPDRVEVALDVLDPDAVLPFWEAALGYRRQPTVEGTVELHHPDGAGPVLWFQETQAPREGRNRLHLDVFVPEDQAPARIAAVLAAGGTVVTAEHAPSWWVLADPEGNELFVCTRQPA
jgi:4a-hydroxytetrahydrobiopterin dehydratase